jgi:hypothetical protein
MEKSDHFRDPQMVNEAAQAVETGRTTMRLEFTAVYVPHFTATEATR